MSELVLRKDYCNKSITSLTLNRPESRNALSTWLLESLEQKIKELAFEPQVRAVIIQGAGDKAFCAGADLKERQGMSKPEVLAFLNLIQRVFLQIAELPMPVIAQINGDAFGGGLELALACDIRVAVAHARLGLTECSLAIIPGAGGTQRLPMIVGLARASELIFTAKKLSAQEALELGLINSFEEAYSLAEKIAKNGPLAVRAAKKALAHTAVQSSIRSGLAAEFAAYITLLDSNDRLEGLEAFREKRQPVYTGS